MRVRVAIALQRIDREPLEAFLEAQALLWGFVVVLSPLSSVQHAPFIWAYGLGFMAWGAAGLWALARWRYYWRRAALMLGTGLWTLTASLAAFYPRGGLAVPLYAMVALATFWLCLRVRYRSEP